MDEKRQINVTIDGHPYPMKIRQSEEEVIRKAAQQINEKLVMYKQKFGAQGQQQPFDFMAMVCLDLVTKYLTNENTTDDTEFVSELRILLGEIDDYIQKSDVL